MRVKMPEKLPAIIETDIIESDMIKVKEYAQNELPGLSEISNIQLERMYNLYLSGSTYSQIASTLNIKKTIIQYVSHTTGWYDSKKSYLREVQEQIKTRVNDSKLKNKDFMLLLVQAYRKKLSTKFNTYLATDDDQHMADIDLKEIGLVMKAIEIVDNLDESGKDPKGKTPAVGINVGNGVTVEKTGENKISITPKETYIGDMLQQHADSLREEERKKLLSSAEEYDINNDEQGDKDEK